MIAANDIVDPDDFCRRCGGRGYVTETTWQGKSLTCTCDLCRGTGHRTVRVDPITG